MTFWQLAFVIGLIMMFAAAASKRR